MLLTRHPCCQPATTTNFGRATRPLIRPGDVCSLVPPPVCQLGRISTYRLAMQGTMEPPAPNNVDASSSTSPSNNTTTANGQRRNSATMRQHARNSSRMADAASRTSDEEGTKTAVKVGMYIAWHHVLR